MKEAVLGWARRYRLQRALSRLAPVPPPPWDQRYGELHVRLVSYLLDSDETRSLFARAERLPSGYGVGFDERVVEYPWLLAHMRGGTVLDAGSTLNHAHVLDRFLPKMQRLHIMTLAPEPVAFPERGISYVYGDLRATPYQDEYFDVVVAISTLEHIGMDTTLYGVVSPRSGDPSADLAHAVNELLRILRPTGVLLATVPYGRREDHGWFRQFGRDDIDALVALVSPRRVHLSVYRYGDRGWQLSSLNEAADERYRDHHADRTTPPDLAAAARAVACIAVLPIG